MILVIAPTTVRRRAGRAGNPLHAANSNCGAHRSDALPLRALPCGCPLDFVQRARFPTRRCRQAFRRDMRRGGVAEFFAKIRGAHIPSSLQIRDLSLRLSNAAHHFCVPRFRYVTGESEGMNA